MSQLDLNNCDKEKIHLITYTQGHGALVVIDHGFKIHHASENLPSFFQKELKVQTLVGSRLNEILGLDLLNYLQKFLKDGKLGRFPESYVNPSTTDRLDVFTFKISHDLIGVEFEVVPKEEVRSEEIISDFVEKVKDQSDLSVITNEACKAIRLMTDMDRVMVYQFFPPSMYGEVIAEDRIADSHPFLKHRFPATDIPKPARDLYLKNRVRFIHDAQEATVEIYPRIETDRFVPLDMTDSRLRGVSKIHTEYMLNMGIRSSLSVAIIIEEKLWGLISCHSKGSVHVSQATREGAQTLSQLLALAISNHQRVQKQNDELLFYQRMHAFFAKIKGTGNPLEYFFREGNHILELFRSSGMVLASREKIDFHGLVPLPDEVRSIKSWLLSQMDSLGKNVFVTDSLSALNSEFESLKHIVSGCLAIRLADLSDEVLILMRAEFLETILWGGDPRKNMDSRNYGGTINPRVSFETWTEVVKNSSLPWRKHEVIGIDHFKNMVFDSLILKERLLSELHNKFLKK